MQKHRLSPWVGRSPGVGNGNPLQCSCLGNPMGRGAWRATVHRVTKSWTWLKDWARQAWRRGVVPEILYFNKLSHDWDNSLRTIAMKVVFPFIFWDIIDIKHYIKVCNVIYKHRAKWLSQQVNIHYFMWLQNFFVLRTLKIYLLSNLQAHNTALLTIV